MPLLKSAIKKLRKDKKKEKINDKLREDLKDAVKNFIKGKSSKKIDEVFSLIDKAAKKNLIHKNKAARLKSKLSKPSVEAPKPKKSSAKSAKKTPKKTSKKK